MGLVATVEAGVRIRYAGGDYTVVGVGDVLQLRAADGDLLLVRPQEVFGAADFRIFGFDAGVQPEAAVGVFDQATKGERSRALRILGHLMDVFPDIEHRAEGYEIEEPPRSKRADEYSRLGTVTLRLEAKKRETKWSERTIYNYRERYLRHGLAGLLDRRHVGGLRQAATFEPRVLEELHSILGEIADKSRVTDQWVFDRLSRTLAERNAEASTPEDLVAIQSLSTFRRKFAPIRAELGWDHATKYRRRPAKKVAQQRRFKAQRAGQYVLIDSSPWDVLAWDPVAGRYVALELTIALDLYTRSIVGFRFTPRTTKGVDAALLLYDIIAPKTLEFGPEGCRWPYVGVPKNLVIAPPKKGTPAPVLIGIPVVAPDTVVVDRNRIFLSLTFQAACQRLGMSIIYARPRRPTDKAHVERVFRTIRDSWLQELPGFKGGSVHDRGRHVEADAVMTVEMIRTSFTRWVVECYQYAPHEGLVLPQAPREEVSPNRMYEESLRLWGFSRVPVTPNVYFETLPTHFAKISDSGVQRLYLKYDDPVLNDLRPAAAKGEGGRKHPFKYDPRDLSKLFFCHPVHGWHPIRWVDAEDPDLPFNDLRLAYAIELTRQRGWQVKDRGRVAETMNEIIVETLERKETTLLAQKERVQHAQLRRDRALWRPEIEDDDGQDGEMALPEIDELPDDDFGTIEDEDDLIGDAA